MAKVCAHINTESFFSHEQNRFDSVKDAIAYFREYVNEAGDATSIMDVYFSEDCPCDSMMNFHDYPSARYAVGTRGGIRKEYV